jgi:glycerophosphoryl diester phosphodiesterase
MSFDHRVLSALRDRGTGLAVCPLFPEVHADYAAAAKALGAVQVAPHHEWVTADDVAALRRAGVRVVPWTANDAAAWDRLIRLGVDGIITDDPEGLLKVLGRL